MIDRRHPFAGQIGGQMMDDVRSDQTKPEIPRLATNIQQNHLREQCRNIQWIDIGSAGNQVIQILRSPIGLTQLDHAVSDRLRHICRQRAFSEWCVRLQRHTLSNGVEPVDLSGVLPQRVLFDRRAEQLLVLVAHNISNAIVPNISAVVSHVVVVVDRGRRVLHLASFLSPRALGAVQSCGRAHRESTGE